MTAPIGAIVHLHLDLVEPIAQGDMIETPTGRRYFVMHVREQQRGKHAGRQHVTATVMGVLMSSDDPPLRTHHIRWYSRDKR